MAAKLSDLATGFRPAISCPDLMSDAEQSTWLPCGIEGFIYCVCFTSGDGDV
jgi:hypothetical protein